MKKIQQYWFAHMMVLKIYGILLLKLTKSIDQIAHTIYIWRLIINPHHYPRIDTAVVSNMINTAMENNWNYLRFHLSPKYDQFISNEYDAISTKRAYRVSTVFALFKKSVLIDLLDRGETAWEFEKIGSIRSNKYDNFYVVTHQPIPCLNGVVKGKLVP